MENMYLYSAIIGGIFLAVQFLLSLTGFVDDLDVDFDVDDFSDTDLDSGFDASDHASGAWFVGILTTRSFFAAMTAFGLAGLGTSQQFPDTPYLALSISLLVGFGMLYFVGWLFRSVRYLNSSGTARIEEAIGENGTVYLKIPGNNEGKGKVTVLIQERSMEYEAMTSGEKIETGATVHVLEVISPGVLEVTLADPQEEPAQEANTTEQYQS